MTAPVRIQRLRTKGFRLQEVSRAINGLPAVCVTRPGPWANPFMIGGWFARGDAAPGNRSLGLVYTQCLDERFLTSRFSRIETPEQAVAWFQWLMDVTIRDFSSIKGKNIACWCPLHYPDGRPYPCHGNVLLDLANR